MRPKRTVFQYKSILYAVTVCLYDHERSVMGTLRSVHDTYIVDASNDAMAVSLGYTYALQSYDLTHEYVTTYCKKHITVKQLAYMNGKFHEVITVDNLGD